MDTQGMKNVLGVEVGVGPIMMLHSGATLDLLAPSTSDFTIDDIAHGLSQICRYAGQCKHFYSVAEHSVLVSDVASGAALEALLHDAAEAFIGDVTRPLKQLLPEYKRIEDTLQLVIRHRFSLPESQSPEVKQADLRVLAAEQAQIMPRGLSQWASAAGISPALVQVQYLDPPTAKRLFLERFYALKGEGH